MLQYYCNISEVSRPIGLINATLNKLETIRLKVFNQLKKNRCRHIKINEQTIATSLFF